jgi:hypothetical protein
MVDDILNLKITNQREFSENVEHYIQKKKCGVMEAVLKVCEETEVDPSDCNRLLSASIKAKLEAEAMELNLIPRGNQLPL